MKRSDLSPEEYPKYHGGYIESIPDIDFLDALQGSAEEVLLTYRKINEEQSNFRYADNKWSIKELLIHLIDVERIFVYRALRFSRYDYTEVPSFDHDKYVEAANAELRTLSSILEEYKFQRQSTIAFYSNLTENALKSIDQLGGSKLSVRASAFFISGHELHHLKVIQERYIPMLD